MIKILKFLKHWRISNELWLMLGYHIWMEHHGQASNICKRIKRIKADKWYIKLFV